MFSIGIGGPSSAGKTTLAELLEIVLRGAIWAARGEAGGDAFIDTAKTLVKVVKQDDFFIPASEQKWPMVAIRAPRISQCQENTDDDMGVDRDCIECVRFEDLEKELGRTASDDCTWDKMPVHIPSCYSSYQHCIAAAIAVIKRQLLETYRHRNHQPAQKTPLFIESNRQGATRLSCQLLIAKGNLVLARLPLGHSKMLPSEQDPETRGFVVRTREAQERVRDGLDVKLFLPVDKDTAFERRFSRPIYQDQSQVNPHGRTEAQHWRQNWYFEHVW